MGVMRTYSSPGVCSPARSGVGDVANLEVVKREGEVVAMVLHEVGSSAGEAAEWLQ